MFEVLGRHIKSLTAKLALRNSDEQELERRVQHLLELQSDCSETIVVASPKLGSPEYACTVAVPSIKLFTWFQKHSLSISSLGIEGQASREFLYRWLASADFCGGQVSALPPPASGIVAPYVRQFVEEGLAIVFCLACDQTVHNIQIQKSDGHVESAYTVWRETWSCPCGQVIYEKTHKARLIRPWHLGR